MQQSSCRDYISDVVTGNLFRLNLK